MYDALTVSRYLIWYSNKQGTPVSNLRLQKLLYFVQAEFIVSKKEPCFNDTIEAWDLGPVVPAVYREFKVFGASSIPNNGINTEGLVSPEDALIINGIIDQCNKYSTSALVEITHNQEPWIKAHNSVFSKEISLSALLEFFKER